MRKLTIALLVALLVLPGCASKYGEQKTKVNYYPACYAPIQDLRAREHDVAKGTATGAAVGALGGALIGFATTGKWQGAAVGAATGAAAGMMAGHAIATSRKEADDNARMAAYLQNIEGDISNLDIVAAAARNSLQCYDKQFAVLIEQIKSKAITRDVAQARFAEISSGREEAIALLGDAVEKGRNLNQQYESAFLDEENLLAKSGKKASNAQARKSLRTAKQRQAALAQKTQDMSREITVAQNDTIQQQKQIQDILGSAMDAKEDARV